MIGVNPATDTAESTAEILKALGDVMDRNARPHAALRALARHGADEGARPRRADGPHVPVALGQRERQPRLRHLAVAHGRGLGQDEAPRHDARARTSCTSRPARARRSRRRRTTAPTRSRSRRAATASRGGTGRSSSTPSSASSARSTWRTGPQITRAALEDHFMGKLLGLPMGCDACFTYHASMSQDELESLEGAARRGRLHVPDVAPGRRRHHAQLPVDLVPRHPDACARLVGKRPAPEFDAWLDDEGIWRRRSRRASASAIRR